MSLPPDIQFFSGLASASYDLDILKEYILHMEQSLREAEAACATSVQATYEPLDIDKADLLSEPFPKILHAGFIISLIIFLESEVGYFSESLQKAENLGLSLKDLSGSLVERFRKYCEHVAKLSFPVSNENWEDVRGVLVIRNCLVHNDGFLSAFGKAATIKAFAKRHGTPTIENDMLSVNADTSLKVLDVIKGFIEAIYQAALDKYPKKKNGP